MSQIFWFRTEFLVLLGSLEFFLIVINCYFYKKKKLYFFWIFVISFKVQSQSFSPANSTPLQSSTSHRCNFCTKHVVFDRPGAVGAVLQAPCLGKKNGFVMSSQ